MLSLALAPDRAQRLGRYEVTAAGGERVRAFIPPPLPPIPPVDLGPFQGLLDRANHALARLKEGFPPSLGLLREIHAILLAGGRGEARDPGEFRHSQNWIGGTRPGNSAFVPPPPHEVVPCLGDLERFLHADTPEIPVLVK